MTEQTGPDPLTLTRETAVALHDLLGQLLDNPATVTDPEYLRQQLHAAIESEVYEYRERTMFWPETGGVTEEIARLATRGAMEVCVRYTAQLRQRLELADSIAGRSQQEIDGKLAILNATDGGNCTAIMKSTYEDRTHHCALSAGHYDADRQPDPTVDGEPGGWHQSAPDGQGDRMVWSDWAGGAEPHNEQP